MHRLVFLLSTCLLFILTARLAAEKTLLEVRAGHVTELAEKVAGTKVKPEPPADVFKLVKYPTPIGEMSAYLSVHEPSEEKRPAIIWLTGGFPVSSPSEYLWEETDIDNEQSARIYRLKDIQMLYPTLRGGAKGNPGHQESFYGEVNDVIAAHAFLAKQEGVDPKRIYLGGHSTGGTLALLVAEATDVFAGVLSLGPVEDHYGKKRATYAWNDREVELRSPVLYLDAIVTPTWIVEGETGNSSSLKALDDANLNAQVQVIEVEGSDHFDHIHSSNELFANAILESSEGELVLEAEAIKQSYLERLREERETTDLRILANFRERGYSLSDAYTFVAYLLSKESEPLVKASREAQGQGFETDGEPEFFENDGSPYYVLKLRTELQPDNLPKLFSLTAKAQSLAKTFELYYDDWGLIR